VSHCDEPASTVSRRILELHRRHAEAVGRVFDAGIDANKADLRSGSLPADCLISLVVGQGREGTTYPEPSQAVTTAAAPPRDIRMSIDGTGQRVVIDGWGEITGANARLLSTLAAPFRAAGEGELLPKDYPYLRPAQLQGELSLESDESLRRCVHRCRRAIAARARGAGVPELPNDTIIENHPWRGYRLNPDHVRLVKPSTPNAGAT